ncbi:hypothetical protein ACW17M_04200 [Vreelandella sp. 2A-K22]
MRFITASAAIASLGLFIAGSGYALSVVTPWLSEEACIISVVKSSSASPAFGTQACQDRFSTQPAFIQLSQSDFDVIDGKAGFVNGSFSARIYNGSALTISNLTVAVMDPETADSDEPVSHYYEVDANIAPLSSGSISFNVYEEYDEARWFIANGRGRLSD